MRGDPWGLAAATQTCTHQGSEVQHRSAHAHRMAAPDLSLLEPQRAPPGPGCLQNSKEKLKSALGTYPQHLTTCPHPRCAPFRGLGLELVCLAEGPCPILHPLASAPSSPWLGDVSRNGSIRI